MHQDQKIAHVRTRSIIAFLLTFTQCICLAFGAEVITGPKLKSQEISPISLSFEQNKGQVSSEVKFFTRGQGFNLYLTEAEAVMVVQRPRVEAATSKAEPDTVVRMGFVGANKTPKVKGLALLDLKTNYFQGATRSPSLVDIPNHEAVEYSHLYQGIDLVYYSRGDVLEYDFRVEPHANPSLVALKFTGGNSVALNRAGDLVISTDVGDVIHQRPMAYQIINGLRVQVEADYRIFENGNVGFELGRYDNNITLIIDPIVSLAYQFWAQPEAIAIDSKGSAYITGRTGSAALPPIAGYRTALQGTFDAFVIKLDPSGTKAVYATYIGAAKATTKGTRIAVDALGNAYVGGTTSSTAFPTTTGAYKTSFVKAQASDNTSFLLKLNAAGNALIYSTYINFNIGYAEEAIRGPIHPS